MRIAAVVLVVALGWGCEDSAVHPDSSASVDALNVEVAQQAEEAGEVQTVLDACGAASEPPAGWSYPSSVTGTGVGETFPDLQLDDCDGQAVSIPAQFADSELTLFTLAAGWCQSCRVETELIMAEVHEPFCGNGLRIVQVLFQDNAGLPATKFFCKQWRSQYGLTFPVLVDPLFLTEELLGDGETPLNLLVDRSGTIIFRQTGYGPAELHAAILENMPQVP